MKIGPRYKMPFKRRYEKKTNYKKRLALIKSGKPRLVVRTSNKHTQIQIVKYEPDGDKTLLSATTQDLQKMGWKYSTSNLPSAYLTGLMIGKKAKGKKIKSLIPDFGVQTTVKGSRLYATLKGVIDSGLEVPVSEEALPSDDRIKGTHIAEFSKTKTHKNQFSKVKPEKITENFEKMKKKIEKD